MQVRTIMEYYFPNLFQISRNCWLFQVDSRCDLFYFRALIWKTFLAPSLQPASALQPPNLARTPQPHQVQPFLASPASQVPFNQATLLDSPILWQTLGCPLEGPSGMFTETETFSGCLNLVLVVQWKAVFVELRELQWNKDTTGCVTLLDMVGCE